MHESRIVGSFNRWIVYCELVQPLFLLDYIPQNIFERLYPKESVKYLGVKTDANLSWQCQVNDLSTKLNRANALSFKTCRFENLLISWSSCENNMLTISHESIFYFLRYAHVRYVKSLFTNIQKQ